MIQLNRRRFRQLAILLCLTAEVIVCSAQTAPVGQAPTAASASAAGNSAQAVIPSVKKLGLASYMLSNSSHMDLLEKAASMKEFYQICSAAADISLTRTNPLATTLPSLLRDALIDLNRTDAKFSVSPFDARFMDGNYLSLAELNQITEIPQKFDGIMGGAFSVKGSNIDIVSFYYAVQTGQMTIHRAVFDVFSLEAFAPAVLSAFSQTIWAQIYSSEALKKALLVSAGVGAGQAQPMPLNSDLLVWQAQAAHDMAQRKFTASLSRSIISIPVTLLLWGLYQGYYEAAYRNADFSTASGIFLGASLAGSAFSLGFSVDTFINLRQLLRTSF